MWNALLVVTMLDVSSLGLCVLHAQTVMMVSAGCRPILSLHLFLRVEREMLHILCDDSSGPIIIDRYIFANRSRPRYYVWASRRSWLDNWPKGDLPGVYTATYGENQ